jgi:CRP-like cAMP-binding protein
MSRSSVRHLLLDLDPDLGRLLEPERRVEARLALAVHVVAVPVGTWDLGRLGGVSPVNVGLLVIDGVIARELTVGDNVCTELLGAGDVVRPWALDEDACLVESLTCWNALSPVRVAVIGQSVAVRLGAYPEVTAVLMDRLGARSQRVAMMQAIAHLNRVDTRLEALLWMLAERWGRVTTDGVVVALVLSHRVLGQLIGARRPTVSTALAGLASSGRVTRLADGTWLLDPASRPTVGSAPDGAIRQRRRLVPTGAPETDLAHQVDLTTPHDAGYAQAGDMWAAIESLYEKSRTQGEDLEALRSEIAALRHRARMVAAARGPRTRLHAWRPVARHGS